MKTLRRTTIRDTPFNPAVHTSSPVLKGIYDRPRPTIVTHTSHTASETRR